MDLERTDGDVPGSQADRSGSARRVGHRTGSNPLDLFSHLAKPADRGAASIFDHAFGGL